MTMPEYIEREAVLQHKRKINGVDWGGEFWDEAVLCEDICKIPAADVVEVVHGEWVKAGSGITERIVCSNCHSHKGSYLKPPFCSQCGAKMDGERRKE